MTANTRSPLTFFTLLFVISLPFWLLSAFVQPENLPINLPVSALMTFNPLIVAVFLVYRAEGGEEVRRLFLRVFDFRKIQAKRWYLAIFLVMPVTMILSYNVMLETNRELPVPHIILLNIPIMFVIFFVTAIGEEIGWQSYAYDRLQTTRNALSASLIVGVVWAAWHVIPNFQAHHPHHPLDWVIWQFLNTVAMRVIMVWIYNNCRQSVFSVVAFHTMINVSNFSFPNNGSHFDPFLSFVILGIMATLIVALWGYTTLAKYRFSTS